MLPGVPAVHHRPGHAVPWEDEHEVERVAAELARRARHTRAPDARARADALARAGARLAQADPRRARQPGRAVRSRRRRPRARRGRADAVHAPRLPRRRSTWAAPSRRCCRVAQLDFVHVHEPFAPSAASVALRHSRALNVGSFHAPTERVLSTQVARRFVELFFGRLDARTAAFEATRELMQHYFPGEYRLLRPGAAVIEPRERTPGAAADRLLPPEERAALRLFLRALRRLPDDLDGGRRSSRRPARRRRRAAQPRARPRHGRRRRARRRARATPTSPSPRRSARCPRPG